MPLFYLDTSALIKRYRSELGTVLLDALFEERLAPDQFVSSFLTVLELTSVVYRLRTAGELGENVARELLSRFRLHIDELVQIWPLNDDVVGSAVRVIEDFHPRAADALHLATALAITNAVNLQVVFITADQDLMRASSEAGLLCINPAQDGALQELRQMRVR
jgi:predicted nucleic acid-binding protein